MCAGGKITFAPNELSNFEHNTKWMANVTDLSGNRKSSTSCVRATNYSLAYLLTHYYKLYELLDPLRHRFAVCMCLRAFMHCIFEKI